MAALDTATACTSPAHRMHLNGSLNRCTVNLYMLSIAASATASLLFRYDSTGPVSPKPQLLETPFPQRGVHLKRSGSATAAAPALAVGAAAGNSDSDNSNEDPRYLCTPRGMSAILPVVGGEPSFSSTEGPPAAAAAAAAAAANAAAPAVVNRFAVQGKPQLFRSSTADAAMPRDAPAPLDVHGLEFGLSEPLPVMPDGTPILRNVKGSPWFV